MKRKYFLYSVLCFSIVSVFAQKMDATISDDGLDRVEENVSVVKNVDSKMVYVSGGTFLMGAKNQEANEKPVHNVSLDSFYISSTEVTQAEYFSVMNENFSQSLGDGRPVEEVSWYDAIVFCNRLSILNELEPVYALNGETDPEKWGSVPRLNSDESIKSEWKKISWNKNANGYRLPTEAEWEYASREASFDEGKIFSGSDDLKSVAWTQENSGGKSHDCGTKNPNRLGLFDMNGNVWEWCWDWYGRYKENGVSNPDGMNENASGRKVRKGGSFKSEEIFCRNTNRASSYPEIRGRDLGFRIARSAEQKDRLYLSKNDVEIDFSENQYSVLINSYKDLETAISERDRLLEKNIRAVVLKKYSDENGFYFDVHSDFFSSKTEAELLNAQLKESGVDGGKVAEFRDYKNHFNGYDSFVNLCPVSYDNGNVSNPTEFSENVIACLKNLPECKGFRMDYFEVADLDNLSLAGKNISGCMLEDFFGDSVSSIHAAAYAEYSDALYKKSLIVVTAKSDEDYFDNKAETFASTFMDGVYEEGSFSLETDDMKCSVVEPFGQLVLCGNSQDGSNYVLIFARGFSKEEFNDFISMSMTKKFPVENIALAKLLFVIPDENDSRDFMKCIFTRVDSSFADENPDSEFSKSIVGYYKSDSSYSQNGKELAATVYQMEYDVVAADAYRKYKRENGFDESDSVLIKGMGAAVQKSNPWSFNFATKSYIVEINSETMTKPEVLEFASEFKLW